MPESERRSATQSFVTKHPRPAHAAPGVRLVSEQRFWRAFHFAFAGVLYATKTQANMRIHLVAGALVLTATMWLHLQRIYVVAIVLTVAFVLAMELFNTAVEAVVDLMTVAHHPLAKIAKDTAAGAVLVASIAALIVGYLCFYEGIIAGGDRVYRAALALPANAVFLSMVVVSIAIVVAKARGGKGSVLQGGVVSGHAALAFAMATFIALLSQNALVAALGLFLAFLVTQSRVEAGIHSSREVILGGLLGTGVSYLLFLFIRTPHML